MPRDDAARILDVIEAAERIKVHCAGLDRLAFGVNDTAMRAVLYDIAVIGEAAKGISDAVRSRYPDVPRADMAGMRDVVVHQYFGIDVNLVWRAATVSVPRVLAALRAEHR